MARITIKTQAELDALPASFAVYTVIEIASDRSDRIYVRKAWGNSSVEARENSSVEAWGNSSVVAWGNSSVVAWGNSSVEAWGNSSVEARENSSVVAYQFAVVFAFSFLALRLFDWACVRAKYKSLKYEVNGKNVTEIHDFAAKDISFETWLERGYLVADGITRKLVEQSKDGEVDIFKVADWRKKQSFVVRKGAHFAHGETLPEARADLDYKLNGRDTSRFKKWKRDEAKPIEEMIVAYRAITGACAMGVRDFMEGVPNLPEAISPDQVAGMIGDSYGSGEFRRFFEA